MPSEQCILQDVANVEQTQTQAQVKLCSSCHCQLSPESSSLLHTEAAIVCTTCRERICAPRSLIEHPERQKDADLLQVDDFGLPVVDHGVPIPFRAPTPPPVVPLFSHSLVSPSSPIPIPHHRQQCSPPTTPTGSPDSHSNPAHPPPSLSLADPHTDITRLRVRSHSQDCLFPGAQFSGTQKSGRSSYEVSVTIVVSPRRQYLAIG
jgi:glucose-induced degradation protein 4